jgi:hypothetical protein
VSVEEQAQDLPVPRADVLEVYEERRDWFVREVTHGSPMAITVELERCATDPQRGAVFGVAEAAQESKGEPTVVLFDTPIDAEDGKPFEGGTTICYLDRDRAGLVLDAISRQWPELL